MSASGTWAAVFRLALSLIVGLAPGLSSSALAAPDVEHRIEGLGLCKDTDQWIYLLDGRYIIGRVRICDGGMFDVTAAPNNIRSNEVMILPGCRGFNIVPNSFMRGRPNTAYPIRTFDDLDFSAVPYTAKPSTSWPLVARALPFVPTKIYDLGVDRGTHWYGYGGLAFVPSVRNTAYPLDENSVIVWMDGCGFARPDTLLAILGQPVSARYSEIVYYQRGEQPAVLRRAFIRTFPRAEVNAEWQQLANRHPIFEKARETGAYEIAVGLGLAYLALQFLKSSEGQEMLRAYQACEERQRQGNGPLIC